AARPSATAWANPSARALKAPSTPSSPMRRHMHLHGRAIDTKLGSSGDSFPPPCRRTIMNKALLSLAALACLAGLPALAQEDVTTIATVPTTQAAAATLTLTLESQGDIERHTIRYQCDDEQALSVQYL